MRSIARISLLIVVLALSGTNIFGLDKQDTKKPPLQNSTAAMSGPGFTINPGKTALLIMDYENDIIGFLAENVRSPLIERANTILKAARQREDSGHLCRGPVSRGLSRGQSTE